MKKKVKKNLISLKTIAVIICILTFTCFWSSRFALAGLVTFQKEYTYQASEADSLLSSRVISLEQVKRLLLEQLGAYLESETEVKNFQLTKDQITVLTAGIVRAEIIDERWDGKTYYLKAKITADPRDVANSIEKLRQDRQKMKELEETRKKAAEALKEVEELKKELEKAKAGKADQEKYKNAVNRLSARDWYEKGIALYSVGTPQEIIEAFTRAIELNPIFEEAYLWRGREYRKLDNYQQAIRDFDKAIELNPKYAEAYMERGDTYERLRDYRRAIREYDRAIQLNPKEAWAYYSRGGAYDNLDDDRQAIRDYDRSIELDPKYLKAYNNRGFTYAKLADYRQAIRDFDRAIELDPKSAIIYNNRGITYGKLGDQRQEIMDRKTAARLGSKTAQDWLRSKGISW